jgi:cytochrome P450
MPSVLPPPPGEGGGEGELQMRHVADGKSSPASPHPSPLPKGEGAIRAPSQLKGPPARRITGHLAEFRADRLGFYTRIARDYGDIVPFRILGYRILLISRPDLIEQVLVTKSKHFVKHFGARLCKPLLGNGLVTSEGSFWRRQRKLAAPAFQGSRTSGYAGTMTRAARQMLDAWADGQTRDVQADMMRLTLRIACTTLFGADVCPDPDAVGRALGEAMDSLVDRAQGSLPLPGWVPSPANRRFARAIRAVDVIVSGLIESRRGTPGGDDLLGSLLAARDDDGLPMSPRQLLDEVRTLFIAGHETTALTLTYSLYLLATNPEARERLRPELLTVLGTRLPEMPDLPRLRYARGIVLESLRLYPPADTIGREAAEDCAIGELAVPKGTNLFMSQWVVHRDARFFPSPERFDPGRWTDDFERALPRFAFFPFGGGPRVCIGQSFAMTEATLVLATICQRFTFAPDPSYRLELRPTLTLRPRENVRLITRTDCHG